MEPFSAFFVISTISNTISIINFLFRTLSRPSALLNLYGPSGILLLVFGSKTTWRTEAQVLGTVKDEYAMDFKRSVQDECTMISVAGAIVAQIAITSLSLNYLSQTYWAARASFVFSIVASLMAVYYSATQQRVMGRLLEAKQVRGWIRGRLPMSRTVKERGRFWDEPQREFRGDPTDFRITEPASAIKDVLRQCFTPSVASVITISAPQILLSSSLIALLLGLGLYFGFVWSRNLDTSAGKGDSRSVLVVYLVALMLCFLVYSISGVLQDDDTRSEETVLLDYLNDFMEKNPIIGAQCVGGDETPSKSPAQDVEDGGTQRSDKYHAAGLQEDLIQPVDLEAGNSARGGK